MRAGICFQLTALAILAMPGASVIAQSPVPAQAEASPGAAQRPHIIVLMLDDVGFAQLSSFGGLVQTPNIDRVAKQGIRFTNYRTAPICSASRAAMLTGRNPHSVHMGGHAAAPLPYPGYDAVIPAEDGTIAANLKAAGYVTAALGKWDHLPSADMTQAGPFTRWPTGQGFDKFYGFIGADADNWEPVLVDGTTPVATPRDPGYHLNNDLADRAIRLFHDRAGRDGAAPVFLYLATGTAHAPHHAPQYWIDRYKGKFDLGWDKVREQVLQQQIAQGLVPKGTKLAPKPDGMPEWSKLSPDAKRLYARQMEVFAASLSHADEQFGRVLNALEAEGQLDNTIIVVTSDNGASAEGAQDGTHSETIFMNGAYPSVAENMAFLDRWGGPETQPHYSLGWAVAGNTPFRYFKQTTHGGGIRVPLLVSWPKGIPARGEVRGQFAYVADITPTILDLARVPAAETLNNTRQSPFEGISLRYSLNSNSAPGPDRAQYFEMYGNKALWSGGWEITTSHRLNPWRMDQSGPINEPWELYNVAADPGQTQNLAAKHPDKVAELSRLFDEQARRYEVLPISNFGDSRTYVMQQMQATLASRKGRWAYSGPTSNIGPLTAPPIALRPFRFDAQISLPTGKETGPLFALGGSSGGMSLYLAQGIPTFAFRDLSGRLTLVQAGSALPAGANRLSIAIDRAAPKPMTPEPVTVTLYAGDQVLVSKQLTLVLPAAYGVSETFDIGIDRGSAVSAEYRADQSFPGQIGQAAFQIR